MIYKHSLHLNRRKSCCRHIPVYQPDKIQIKLAHQPGNMQRPTRKPLQGDPSVRLMSQSALLPTRDFTRKQFLRDSPFWSGMIFAIGCRQRKPGHRGSQFDGEISFKSYGPKIGKIGRIHMKVKHTDKGTTTTHGPNCHMEDNVEFHYTVQRYARNALRM